MFAPLRTYTAYRPKLSPIVLAALGVVTTVFSATPFLVPTISSELGVSLGTAGSVSTAQVGGFALASFIAGRWLRTGHKLLMLGGVLVVVANVASALVPGFEAVVATRFVAGLGMGTMTWVGWAQGSRVERGFAEVAAVGPLIATISSPVISMLAQSGGYRLVYWALAAVSAAALFAPGSLASSPPVGRRVSGSRSNRVLLGALLLLTLSGSALFVFCAAAGARAGLSPLVVSLAFSANSLTGLAATRRHSNKPGLWLGVTAFSALLTGAVASPVAFLVGMSVWGFGFWMAVPGVMKMLAARSLRPDERMGDAQSLMAVGRVVGPGLGGLILGADRFVGLSAFSSSVMAASAVTVGAVSRRRDSQIANTP